MSETCIFMGQIASKLQRTRQQWSSLQQSALLVEPDKGTLFSVVSLRGDASVFKQHTVLRQPVKLLLTLNNAHLTKTLTIFWVTLFR